MTSATITGTVEAIELQAGFTRPSGHASYVTRLVHATLALADGRKAYVQTAIGEMAYYAPGSMGPLGAEHFHANTTQAQAQAAAASDGRWPWAIEGDCVIAVPTKGSPFEGTTAYPYSRPILTVWLDDVVTVRGSVEERTSKHGTEYLVVKRAQVVHLDRPLEAQERVA